MFSEPQKPEHVKTALHRLCTNTHFMTMLKEWHHRWSDSCAALPSYKGEDLTREVGYCQAYREILEEIEQHMPTFDQETDE